MNVGVILQRAMALASALRVGNKGRHPGPHIKKAKLIVIEKFTEPQNI